MTLALGSVVGGQYVLEELSRRREGAEWYVGRSRTTDERVWLIYGAGVEASSEYWNQRRKCKHPKLLRIIDFGQLEGQSYVVMEYAAGTFVSDLTVQPSLAEIYAWGLHVLDALRAVHETGLSFGELGTSHWIVDGSDLRLAGLGLRHHGRVRTTSAPEEIVQEGTIGKRTDLYVVGANLFELITGEPLFILREDSELAAKILSERPRLLHEVRIDVPLSLSMLLRQLLRKKASDRMATAKEAYDVLLKISRGEAWKPSAESSRSLAPLLDQQLPSLDGQSTKRPVVAFVVGGLFLLVALYVMLRPRNEPETKPYEPPKANGSAVTPEVNTKSEAARKLLEKKERPERAPSPL